MCVSPTTHSHPLAIQGATLQASAIAALMRSGETLEGDRYLESLDMVLRRLAREGPEPVDYRQALQTIADGLAAGHEPAACVRHSGHRTGGQRGCSEGALLLLFRP